MLQLAILACLVSSPKDCTVAYLTAPQPLSARQCLMRGMPQIARWGDAHPDYQVKKFRCVAAGRVAFPEVGQEI